MDNRLFVPLFILIVLYGSGIMLYHNIEGWSYIDSAYFLTVTFTTIGYGDIYPHTETGKIITMFYDISGVCVALYTFAIIADMMTVHDDRNRRILQDLLKTTGMGKPPEVKQ